MNKIVLITVISISTLLAGCGTAPVQKPSAQTPGNTPPPTVVTAASNSTATAPNPTPEPKNQPYSVTISTHTQGDIKVQYPQIKGLGDDAKERTVNDLIKTMS